MHFVDARLEQLQLSKVEAARRGFPNPSTLAKVRDKDGQNTPTVRTLLRIDRALGWQPGSAAVVLLGGFPLTVTARTTRRVRDKERAAEPMTPDEVMTRLLGQLREEISLTRRDLASVDDRLARLIVVHDRIAEEFSSSGALVDQFGVDVAGED